MKRRTEETKKRLDEQADEADLESFPASDPPAYAATTVGAPRRTSKAAGKPARSGSAKKK